MRIEIENDGLVRLITYEDAQRKEFVEYRADGIIMTLDAEETENELWTEGDIYRYAKDDEVLELPKWWDTDDSSKETPNQRYELGADSYKIEFPTKGTTFFSYKGNTLNKTIFASGYIVHWYRPSSTEGWTHRDGGPAIIHPNGLEIYVQKDLVHRNINDGPAIIWPNVLNAWMENGELIKYESPFTAEVVIKKELICPTQEEIDEYNRKNNQKG